MKALLRACNLQYLGDLGDLGEDTDDQSFNSRNNDSGINMDFMLYAAFSQVKKNSEACSAKKRYSEKDRLSFRPSFSTIFEMRSRKIEAGSIS
jgi:hypothetical protein